MSTESENEHGLDASHAADRIEERAGGTCWWPEWIPSRSSERVPRCGRPATHQILGKSTYLRVCEFHAQIARELQNPLLEKANERVDEEDPGSA